MWSSGSFLVVGASERDSGAPGLRMCAGQGEAGCPRRWRCSEAVRSAHCRLTLRPQIMAQEGAAPAATVSGPAERAGFLLLNRLGSL